MQFRYVVKEKPQDTQPTPRVKSEPIDDGLSENQDVIIIEESENGASQLNSGTSVRRVIPGSQRPPAEKATGNSLAVQQTAVSKRTLPLQQGAPIDGAHSHQSQQRDSVPVQGRMPSVSHLPIVSWRVTNQKA